MPYKKPELSPDEIKLLEIESLRNFRTCFEDDPVQLYWLSVRLLELDNAEYGELRITWDRGHPDKMTLTTSDKFSELPLPSSATPQGRELLSKK